MYAYWDAESVTFTVTIILTPCTCIQSPSHYWRTFSFSRYLTLLWSICWVSLLPVETKPLYFAAMLFWFWSLFWFSGFWFLPYLVYVVFWLPDHFQFPVPDLCSSFLIKILNTCTCLCPCCLSEGKNAFPMQLRLSMNSLLWGLKWKLKSMGFFFSCKFNSVQVVSFQIPSLQG